MPSSRYDLRNLGPSPSIAQRSKSKTPSSDIIAQNDADETMSMISLQVLRELSNTQTFYALKDLQRFTIACGEATKILNAALEELAFKLSETLDSASLMKPLQEME
ncbi:hypothetical protein N7539_008598 [Penicillium diatomitis]|uniref:Uncharacterized protein n=1 Tax=Penicillium diatomitis TaxID=2819901 RepID=A0A9X0BLW4_9EURO|nr:uncharacterized protein N7539_008598 [Penicillium diatomitis]KAJ5472029.1 hypothetical protein N7539_008598 [Penicillium diatomitis]